VGGDVSIDNEVFLVTDFINLNIKPDQSFGDVHRDIVCVRVFIRVSAHMYISIYVYHVFIKKRVALGQISLGEAARNVIHVDKAWDRQPGNMEQTRCLS
jgi:hypothetical protein